MSAIAFRKYGVKKWFWCLEAYLRLWFMLLRLRFSSPEWLQQSLHLKPSEGNHMAQVESNQSLALHEAVRIAGRAHFMQVHCLPKSLVLAAMLNRRHQRARVAVGISKQNDEFASHAWVEVLDDTQWRMVGEPDTVPQQFTRVWF